MYVVTPHHLRRAHGRRFITSLQIARGPRAARDERAATRCGVVQSGMSVAPRRLPDGDLAGGLGTDFDQQLRIGMRGRVGDLLARALLDQMAGIEHGGFLGEVAGRRDVVRDVERARDCRSCLRSSSRLRMPRRTDTSSIEVGSSASSTSGCTESARAMATRWRCPPEQLVRTPLEVVHRPAVRPTLSSSASDLGLDAALPLKVGAMEAQRALEMVADAFASGSGSRTDPGTPSALRSDSVQVAGPRSARMSSPLKRMAPLRGLVDAGSACGRQVRFARPGLAHQRQRPPAHQLQRDARAEPGGWSGLTGRRRATKSLSTLSISIDGATRCVGGAGRF